MDATPSENDPGRGRYPSTTRDKISPTTEISIQMYTNTPETSPAGLLLDIAHSMRHCVGLICVEGGPNNAAAVADLAMRLMSRPAVALRAQVEGWNKVRIVRELW